MRIAVATKLSLYKLVSDYELLPPSKVVEFRKVPRAPSYFLLWHDDRGDRTAYFTAWAGKMVLRVSTISSADTVTSSTYYPSEKRIAELGLAKET
jgi:hypothetical protein